MKDRNYLGFEMSEEYHNIAINRIKAYDRQISLAKYVEKNDT
jgi:DNA modification methylase